MFFHSKLLTSVGDLGLQADALLLTPKRSIDSIQKTDINVTIENGYADLSRLVPITVPANIDISSDGIIIHFVPFRLSGGQIIHVKILEEQFEYTIDSVSEKIIKGESDFQKKEENGVIFRLYAPSTDSPRPLILFLHGGGECGSDNLLQLTGTLGAISLAERFPDFYVMAPQAPDNGVSIEQMLADFNHFSSFDTMDLGTPTGYGKSKRGWNRDYLSKVSAEIQRLIDSGKVDSSRIYLTGMSMGGGGCLEMLSVAPKLFAAACIICPSMNSDTYSVLHELPDVPCWFASAYIDHQLNRHVFLLKACTHLWEKGRTDVKLTLFTSEELKKYHLGTATGITNEQIHAENHNCWTLVYHNEHHMLSWMVSQFK